MSRSLSMVKPSGNSSGGAIAAIALNFQPNAAVSTPPQVSRDVKPRHRPSTAPQVSAPLFFLEILAHVLRCTKRSGNSQPSWTSSKCIQVP